MVAGNTMSTNYRGIQHLTELDGKVAKQISNK